MGNLKDLGIGDSVLVHSNIDGGRKIKLIRRVTEKYLYLEGSEDRYSRDYGRMRVVPKWSGVGHSFITPNTKEALEILERNRFSLEIAHVRWALIPIHAMLEIRKILNAIKPEEMWVNAEGPGSLAEKDHARRLVERLSAAGIGPSAVLEVAR